MFIRFSARARIGVHNRCGLSIGVIVARAKRFQGGIRSKTLESGLSCKESIAQFPYVNGDLFEERLPVAAFNRDMRNLLIVGCRPLPLGEGWVRDLAAKGKQTLPQPPSLVSPQLGLEADSLRTELAVPIRYAARRAPSAGRAHRVRSPRVSKDVLKVIHPLFLDELRAEFEQLKQRRDAGRAVSEPPAVAGGLEHFHRKLAGLLFLAEVSLSIFMQSQMVQGTAPH